VMKLSLVLSTHQATFKALAFQGDFERNIERIAECGYDGVELAIRDPTLIDSDQVAEVIEKYNLSVSAIGTGQAWGEDRLSFTDPDSSVRKKALERFFAHINLANSLKAIVIIGLIRGIGGMSDIKKEQGWLVDALRKCSEMAQEKGIRLALEPINRYETVLINNATEGLEYLERVGSKNLGLLLDTFHMNIEEPSIEASIKNCGGRIFHFHVADSNRWYPGAGHLDFSSVLKALFGTKYEGFISGEFLPEPEAYLSASRSVSYLRALQARIE